MSSDSVNPAQSDALMDEVWGGLAAMLVALPSAVAFGVIIFGPLGGTYASLGAIAGVLGTAALGLIAPAVGGTNRLISAPCAPAAAVLSGLVVEMVHKGIAAPAVLLSVSLIAATCGLMQIMFGVLRVGRLIKYVPYPVVSGYLSGVGLVIVVGQVPIFMGAPRGTGFFAAVSTPSLWSWQSILIGVATIAAVVAAPHLTKRVPAVIVGLGVAVLVYFGMAAFDPALMSLTDNHMVIGRLSEGGGFLDAFKGHWMGISEVHMSEIVGLLAPAATLAALLSIDTLKTCVVLDSLTRSRHDSNRELIAQGLGNLGASLIGGIPGAGQMGATLVNMSSGGKTRISGLVEGGLAIVAFLLLGNVLSWVPVAALAGILLVVGVRMFDWHSLSFVRSRATILDFGVVVAVVVVAKAVSLIAASATGVGLAILLFIREQVGVSVVHRKSYGNQVFSKEVRGPEEMAVLEKHGSMTAIFDLQGSLFFGTADQLYTALEPELKVRKHIILDFRRVQSIDLTAVHILNLANDMLSERGGMLIFSHVSRRLASGRDIAAYFAQIGLVGAAQKTLLFPELDTALQWAEEAIIAGTNVQKPEPQPLTLREIEAFTGRKDETIADLEKFMTTRSVQPGEKIFAKGETGDELFVVRNGAVRIVLPLNHQREHHIATFGRGSFFGEMAFLDNAPRSADAVAECPLELFVLSRAHFEAFAPHHKLAALALLDGIARTLAQRLRYTNIEMAALEEG